MHNTTRQRTPSLTGKRGNHMKNNTIHGNTIRTILTRNMNNWATRRDDEYMAQSRTSMVCRGDYEMTRNDIVGLCHNVDDVIFALTATPMDLFCGIITYDGIQRKWNGFTWAIN